ncbi:MAG: Hydroxyacylglutathione hydrolase [Turneriella sp.]|nr:Hydroxyacylglutathione hydrolase [Turneriella sp.]
MRTLEAKPAKIFPVNDFIYRITLPQPFYAPNQVYLIRDEKNMLIDSGYVESLGMLALALRELGLSMNDIDILFYTHPHIDHITGGLLWNTYAKKTERWGHHLMPQDIVDYPDFINNWQRDTARILTRAFKDKQARATRIRRSNERWTKFVKRFENATTNLTHLSKPDTPSSTQNLTGKIGDRAVRLERLLKNGDTFSTGKLKWEVLETPGHNTWHLTPVETTQRFAFTGDLLIGNIPTIYDDFDGNLELYQKSLTILLDLRKKYPQMRFLPAHGEEISQPERAIKVLQKTLGILENGLLKKLVEGRKDLVQLLESAFGTKIESGGLFIAALELLEAILHKLMREGRVGSQIYEDGYEEFYLKH